MVMIFGYISFLYFPPNRFFTLEFFSRLLYMSYICFAHPETRLCQVVPELVGFKKNKIVDGQ